MVFATAKLPSQDRTLTVQSKAPIRSQTRQLQAHLAPRAMRSSHSKVQPDGRSSIPEPREPLRGGDKLLTHRPILRGLLELIAGDAPRQAKKPTCGVLGKPPLTRQRQQTPTGQRESNFPRENSLSASIARSCSATSFFSFAFSDSRALRRRAPETSCRRTCCASGRRPPR
jgi:hypothetical protein